MTVLMCMALNIYFEARNQDWDGQLAVAHVVQNRVLDSRFPNTHCSVIKDGGERRHQCQFSWYCDGKSDAPRDVRAWRNAMQVARSFWKYEDPTNGALFYHADYVQPRWAGTNYNVIGRHKFYHALYD